MRIEREEEEGHNPSESESESEGEIEYGDERVVSIEELEYSARFDWD